MTQDAKQPEHTPEPWQIRGRFTSHAGFEVVEVETEKGKHVGQMSEWDDARRIVACVNACEGIPTATLEMADGISEWFR